MFIPKNLSKKILDLWVQSLPLSLISLSYLLISFSNAFFMAQYKNDFILAGYGLGITIFQGTTFGFINSASLGYLSLASQTFGLRQTNLLSIILQKQVMISFIFFLIFQSPLLFIDQILHKFISNDQVIYNAKWLLISHIPAGFFCCFWEPLKNTIIASGEYAYPSKLQNMTSVIYVISMFIFTHVCQLSVFGVGLSRCISEFLNFYFGYRYLKNHNELNEMIKPLQKEAFQNWISYIKLTFPAGMIIYLEWLFFEINTLLVSMLNDEVQLASQTAMVSIILFFYMIPRGIGDCCCSVVGNLMGESRPEDAKDFTYVSIYGSMILTIIYAIFGHFAKPFFVNSFTTGPEMAERFIHIYHIYLYVFFLIDTLQCILGSLIRAIGEQEYAAKVFFIVYFVFGIAFSYSMIHTFGFEVEGAWVANSILSAVGVLFFFQKIYTSDFNKNSINIVKEIELQQSQKQTLL